MNLAPSVRPFRIVLGSASPRRKFLLREAGVPVTVRVSHADETMPPGIKAKDLPMLLAIKKATAIKINKNELLITADTVVALDDKILNKPADEQEAFEMLSRLSGRRHTVITVVCFTTLKSRRLIDDYTHVTFHKLKDQEIKNYIQRYKPFDKAGSYGAQDCLPIGINPCSPEEIEFLRRIGKSDLAEKSFTKKTAAGIVAIKKMEGSYFNVMGLPLHKVYCQLETIFD